MRTALITGGSRGIGRGISVGLARAGYNVVINFKQNQAAGEETARVAEAAARTAGHEIVAAIRKGDIGETPDRQGLVEFTKERFGRLDLLVNNAGVAPNVRADLLQASEESFDRLIKINVKGPYFLTQLAANWMIDLKKGDLAEFHPKIVTVSSISAYTASINRGDYCVSKAALSMVTPLFASRLAEHGIGVYEIRPGVIATDMTAGVKEKYDSLIQNGLTPIPRWGEPDDVAKAVVAIANDSFPFSTGDVFNVDGGFHLRRL
jgi:NAD(P)-dependent dehydrogenase (short-subunit alcohol dehydrogenase family)